MRFSLQGKLVLIGLLALLVAALAGSLAALAFDSRALVLSSGLLAAVLIWLALSSRVLRPVGELIATLTDHVASMKDGDFSISIARRRGDELGDLVSAHNTLGNVLRQERQSLFQRELLLDTVIQTTSLALVLVDARGKIVYSNAAARHLLNEGRPLNGEVFETIIDGVDPAFREAVLRERDGLFTVESGDEAQAFHLSCNDFTLNVQKHRLYLFKQLTHELNRQEVATWKKVIRVISHELNNSLAPISSLAHSGALLQERRGDPEADGERLATIFATIEDRATHLKDFIEGYARFARLPAPRLSEVEWGPFVDTLRQTVSFEVDGEIPGDPVHLDPAQMEQVLINLIKNAHESGSSSGEVRLAISTAGEGWRIDVSDRGSGMSQTVLASALLPFYSTKKTGTGLGLPLCREIVEAHGGRLSLANREHGGLRVSLWLPLHR